MIELVIEVNIFEEAKQLLDEKKEKSLIFDMVIQWLNIGNGEQQ